MTRSHLVILVRMLLGSLIAAAVVYQFIYGQQHNPNFDVTNFFSFFTIQSNIMASAVFLAAGLGAFTGRKSGIFDALRGAVTLYMAMTGVIYALLLSGNEVSLQTTVPWVNLILHYIAPVVMVSDWLINPPRQVQGRVAITWLAYPLLYVGYSLIRGSEVQWYPYPFLNVSQHGYMQVLLNCIAISCGVVALCWVLYKLGKLQRQQRK